MNSGIYCIQNTVDGKRYIGQSVNLRKRQHHHFSVLANNAHANAHLQHAFNKYGKDNFVWSVVEECDPRDLNVFEEAWIEYHKTFLDKTRGYNLTAGGESSKPMLGRKHSKETREKLCAARRRRTKVTVMSAEARARIGAALKGRTYTAATLEKMRVAHTGVRQTIETRAKRAKSLLGNKNSLGFHPTEESRAKMSAARKGLKNALGYRHTEAELAKMRTGHAARKVYLATLEQGGS